MIAIRKSRWARKPRVLRLPLLLVLLSLALPSAVRATTVTFTSSGTTNWVAPAGVTTITVECWGAGGGGGGGNTSASGGGGGGAYAIKNSFAVTPGNSYSYTVGAGGASDAAGGNSSFNTSACVAAGGAAGSQGTPGSGGAGGLASVSTGDVKFSGGSGASGQVVNHGGGGGGSAGTAANGNTASSITGATAVTGGGPGGNGGSSGNGNPPASGPGGGGGGGIAFGPVSGGAGFAGQIRITYTAVTTTSRKGQVIIGQAQPSNPHLLAGARVAATLRGATPGPTSCSSSCSPLASVRPGIVVCFRGTVT
jgi:hypothetical protein